MDAWVKIGQIFITELQKQQRVMDEQEVSTHKRNMLLSRKSNNNYESQEIEIPAPDSSTTKYGDTSTGVSVKQTTSEESLYSVKDSTFDYCSLHSWSDVEKSLHSWSDVEKEFIDALNITIESSDYTLPLTATTVVSLYTHNQLSRKCRGTNSWNGFLRILSFYLYGRHWPMEQRLLERLRCFDDKSWFNMYWEHFKRPIGFKQCIVTVFLLEDDLPNGFAITIKDVTDKMLYFQSRLPVRLINRKSCKRRQLPVFRVNNKNTLTRIFFT